MYTVEEHLQKVLKKLEKWLDEYGFYFSPTKTVCMHLCRLRGLHHDPTLKLLDIPIPIVKHLKS